MNVKDMETRAFELHDGGFHCAEAVALTIMEGFDPDPADGFSWAARTSLPLAADPALLVSP